MKKKLTTKNRVQLGIVALPLILLVVFIVLNMQTVEMNLIFAQVAISRSLMLLATFVIGVSAGWFLKSWVSLKTRREAHLQNR